MKLRLLLIASLGFSVYLAGCAKNNVNDDTATRNRNAMEPTRVNYNTGKVEQGQTYDPTRTNPNVTDVRYDNTNMNNADGQRPRVKVADMAAKRLTAMSEIDTANVIVTDNNAYVALKLSAGEKLSNGLENKISKKVKSVDNSIDRVFISANPDFYKRMTSYSDDIRSGKPISGFFNEFTRSIQRVFPDVK